MLCQYFAKILQTILGEISKLLHNLTGNILAKQIKGRVLHDFQVLFYIYKKLPTYKAPSLTL